MAPGALLLFTVIGPVGRGLSSGLTNGLVWMTQNLGVIGYAGWTGRPRIWRVVTSTVPWAAA